MQPKKCEPSTARHACIQAHNRGQKTYLDNTFQCLVKVSNMFFENPWMANLASTMAFQAFSMLPYLACWSIRLIAHKDVAITIVFTRLFVNTFALLKCHLLHHTHAIQNPNKSSMTWLDPLLYLLKQL
jgi:hypothetical protein